MGKHRMIPKKKERRLKMVVYKRRREELQWCGRLDEEPIPYPNQFG